MWLERDGDLADFGHALLGGVLWVFLCDALLSGGFGPVPLEEAVTDPALSRAGEGLGENTAAAIRGHVSICKCGNGGC